MKRNQVDSLIRIFVYLWLLAACLCCVQTHGQVAVAPYITSQPQFLDNNGNPLAAGCVSTFAAGTATPQATYTDSTGTVQNANPIILNSGGFPSSGIWLASSAYKFVVKSFGGTACASGSTIRTEDNLTQANFLNAVTKSGDNTLSGKNNFTGSNTFGNINNDLYVSSPSVSGTYTTCQAAVTAAGASNRIIHIPPDYNGPDCPLNVGKNIMLWNEDSTRLYVNDGFNWFQNTGGNTDSTIHVMGARSTIGAGGAFVTGYFTSTLQNGVVGTGIGVDGIAAEANLTGTLTGTLPVLQAAEQSALVQSTGGTVTTANGVEGYVNSLVGSTTAITNVRGVYGLGCNVIAGAAPTNCYGAEATEQIAGATRNYSLASNGFNLAKYGSNAGASGWDAEDHLHITHRWLYNDSSDNVNIQAISSAGLFLRESGGAVVAQIGLNAFNFYAAPTPQAAAFVGLGKAGLPWADLYMGTAGTTNFHFVPAITGAARTVNIIDPAATTTLGLSYNTGSSVYQTKRAVSGCTTAASVGGNCATDITVTWSTAFADANYSVSCTGMSPSAGFPSNPYIVSKAAGNAHINYFAVTAVAAAYTSIDCIAVHD